MFRNSIVCESCIMALEDEGVPEGAEASMAIELGADIAAHLCDQIESAGDIKCACACHPPALTKWSGKNKELTPEVITQMYNQTFL